MADAARVAAWFASWAEGGSTDRWGILATLARVGEDALRDILRPHEEGGGAGVPEPTVALEGEQRSVAELRSLLDDALDALTYLEIGFQLGLPPGENVSLSDLSGLPAHVETDLAKLVTSQAFLRYLDVYLFFGIRFLAARDPVLAKAAEALSDENEILRDQVNRPGLPLVMAPTVSCDPDALMKALEGLSRTRSHAEEVALSFLDGFRRKRGSENAEAEERGPQREGDRADEPRQLELWIRGLLPELDGAAVPVPNDPGLGSACIAPAWPDPEKRQRFQEIAEGLQSWATQRASVYLSLRSPDPTEPPLNTETTDTPKDGWRCDTPVNARLALADLYWIAGILRAEVTPRGEVKYGYASWLGLLRSRAMLQCDEALAKSLQKTEQILRSVFSIACELIQNAADLRAEEERLAAREDLPAKDRPPTTAGWRGVLDDEMRAIARHRVLRDYKTPPKVPWTFRAPGKGPVWSERLTTGEHVRGLTGVALSGGGIRSATFCLGAMQGLQDLDLLRQVDYLSTVSGGGFLGGWLVGNVRRSRYWLGSLAPWERSIAHLRSYSNYLAPRTGVLSMDTWSLGAIWVRNAFLIQITALGWLLFTFSLVYLGRLAFLGSVYEAARAYSRQQMEPSQSLALLMSALVLSMILLSFIPDDRKAPSGKLMRLRSCAMIPALLAGCYAVFKDFEFAAMHRAAILPWLLALVKGQPGAPFRVLTPFTILAGAAFVLLLLSNANLKRFSEARWIRWLAVLPAWIAGTVLAANVYAGARFELWLHFLRGAYNIDADHAVHYSVILRYGWHLWPTALVITAAGFALICGASLFSAAYKSAAETGLHLQGGRLVQGALGSVGIALLCTGVVHLCLCGMLYAGFHLRPAMTPRIAGFDSAAFVVAPFLVLLSFSLGILFMIGLSGKFSNEEQREWWTRFGGWVLVVSLIGVAIPGVVFGGPWLVAKVSNPHHAAIKWSALAGWLGTVVSGLFAGKSSKTAEPGASKSPPLELLAKVAGFLFLITAGFVGAEVLFGFFWALLDVPPRGVSSVVGATTWLPISATGCVLFLCGGLFSWLFEINIFGLNQLYRNRLVRCYLGATRWRPGMRSPEPFTKFDFADDLDLVDLGPAGVKFRDEFRGPFPILNCSLNLAGSSDLALHTRHSASFSLTPLYCGADLPRVGYAKTTEFANGVRLGQAVAISGAAASPNMGYNTSPLVAFLLTMFNVRLGWWFPNPGRPSWNARGLSSSFYYMLMELVGEASEKRRFLNVSDGGHFENLGIYELVRRGCKVIVACDAECDEDMAFGGLANAVRLCATDFGAVIDIDVSSLRKQPNGQSAMHSAVGTITYSNGSLGRLIYVKASLTGDEDVSICQYRSAHPTFPHESTANQFFTEDQFESYRRLGRHAVSKTFRGCAPGEHLVTLADRLLDMLAPGSANSESFLRHTRQLDRIWERLRMTLGAPAVASLFAELMGLQPPVPLPLTQEDTCIGLELLQFMEDVFLDLRLDDSWEHPDNRGWAMLFMSWARSPRFRQIWQGTHRTFGIRFEYFCERRLGLYRDEPVLRVATQV